MRRSWVQACGHCRILSLWKLPGTKMSATAVERVTCLDGMRGLAALWVLVGHTMLLTGFRVPILGQPELGVDLFILLSGYLMTYQYLARRQREDWSRGRTWMEFWTRRFFRLSPLYFVLLFVALACGGALYEDRALIDQALDRNMQMPERYTDFSVSNVFLHLTYLFALIPEYAFRTPLPDWSLGLEMQFYAVFPFLALLGARWGWLRMVCLSTLVGFLAVLALKIFSIRFPLPSFLPLKLHFFLAGMLIALGSRRWLFLAVALILASAPYGGAVSFTHILAREVVVFIFFILVSFQNSTPISHFSALLGSKAFFWLGELSYGAYLIHLLILHPVASYVIETNGVGQAASTRFLIVFPVVMVLTYMLAAVGLHLLERPGQNLGRTVIQAFRAKSVVPTTAS